MSAMIQFQSAHAFLRATAATAVARLKKNKSRRNTVCPSVCHTSRSVKNSAT